LGKGERKPGQWGIDGQSRDNFGAQLNQQLDRLRQELKGDTYRPLPVRQHPIPNRDKPGEYRRLGIPAICDRVCQQALLNRLEPIFEPISMMPALGIGEGDQRRMRCARFGKRFKVDRSGSWMRISETFSAPWIMKSFSLW
jgi:RNA-directed DNA polymerase